MKKRSVSAQRHGSSGTHQHRSSKQCICVALGRQTAGLDLLNVTSAANGNNLLVGYFLDPDGEQYWMVVNKDRSKTLTAAQLAVNM